MAKWDCLPKLREKCCDNFAMANPSDMSFQMLTGHHPSCSNAPDAVAVFEMACEVVEELLKGIETWANDEDGVHPEAWGAYFGASIVIRGEVPPWPKPD